MKRLHVYCITIFGELAMLAMAQERPPVGDGLQVVDKKLLNYWAESTCYKRGDGSEPNVKEQCKKICFPNPDPNKMSASTCWFGDSKWLDGSSGKPLEDQNKNIPPLSVKGGYCGCDDPVILFGGDFFIKSVTEAGKIIEKVLCPVLQALDVVIEFGSLAIPPPGKAIQGGMIAAVKTAKAYKYAYEAQDAAQQWADMIFGGLSLSKEAGCGVPPFSISKLVAKFLDFANVPDTTIPGGVDYRSLPCPKGGCRGTRHGERENDKNPKSEPPIKSTAAPNKSTAAPNKSTAAPNKSTAVESTPTGTASFTPSATATANCKAVAESMDMSQPNEKRDSNVTVHSRRIEKRGRPKSGIACIGDVASWKIYSFNYPGSGEFLNELDGDHLAYGWSDGDSCTEYEWGHAFFRGKNDKDKGQHKYDTEHVLEWSVITNFFTTMNGKYKPDAFTHPDPLENGKKVNFCTYWKVSWDFQKGQFMDNPVPKSGQTSNIQQRTPIDWIAANYPYRQKGQGGAAFLDELTLLQKKINSPAKNNMFSNSPIFRDDTMDNLIQRKNSRNPQEEWGAVSRGIQNIRSVIGVFHYMKEGEIPKIFRDQKIRLGMVIDGIDQNLSKTPKVIEENKIKRTYLPWKPLGLGKAWDEYMDEVFGNAKDKGITFVERNLKQLKDEYTSQLAKDRAKDDPNASKEARNKIAEWAKLRKYVEEIIPKLEESWHKAKDWKKPW